MLNTKVSRQHIVWVKTICTGSPVISTANCNKEAIATFFRRLTSAVFRKLYLLQTALAQSCDYLLIASKNFNTAVNNCDEAKIGEIMKYSHVNVIVNEFIIATNCSGSVYFLVFCFVFSNCHLLFLIKHFFPLFFTKKFTTRPNSF